MVRVVLAGPEGFTGSEFTDSYVKLTFLKPGVQYPQPFDLATIKAQLPTENWPTTRTYTVRSWDSASNELTIDFVVHGDSGIAGPWAASAQPGDEVLLTGPGGAYRPDPRADWHLFVGDESALPAIAAALEHLAENATGLALLEVGQESGILELSAPSGVEIRWLVADGRPVGEALGSQASGLTLPSGHIEAFVHGEAGFVKEFRRILRIDHALEKDRLSISGYWRIGADEDGWRVGKAEWNRQAEETEKAAGLS